MPERSPQPNILSRGEVFRFSPKFWLLVVLSGLGAGFAGGLLMRLFHATQHLGYAYTSGHGDFLSAVAHVSAGRRLLMLLGAAAVAAAVRALLHLTHQESGGDLSESIWFHSGRLPFFRTVVRGVLSIVAVGMGVSLGREGALKQTGAAIASTLSKWFKVPPAQQRLLVAYAAGAGMAAAYNVPFGGALFSAEVLLGSLSLPIILPALATSFIATAVSWLLLPNEPTYKIPAYVFHPSDAVWACVAAPIFGLVAMAWVRAITWADDAKPKGWRAYVAPVVVFAILGLVAIWFPDALGNGKGLVQRTYTDQLSLGLLLPLLLIKFLAAPGCLGSGVPGGLFTPTLTVGALLGACLGHFWAAFFPASDLGVFAIIGSAAVLAAATQGPISSVAFLIELTHHVDALMVPMLLAIVGASLLTQRLENRSVYSARVRKGMLAARKMRLQGTAFDRYATEDFSLATSAATIATVQHRLLTTGRPLFVVDNGGQLIGTVTSNDLEECSLPFDTLTAGDVAQPTDRLSSKISEGDAVLHLRREPGRIFPVVEPYSGQLLGAVKAESPEGEQPL